MMKQGPVARKKSCACSLLLVLLNSTTSVEFPRKEDLLPVCWLRSLLGFCVGLGTSFPACSNEPESRDPANWHHVAQVLVGMSVSQRGVLPLGCVPKPSTGHLCHGVAHGDADLPKCPTCLHCLPRLMLKPAAMPVAVGSCQRSVLPSDLGTCSCQGLSTLLDPSLTGHAPSPRGGTRVTSSSPSRSVRRP